MSDEDLSLPMSPEEEIIFREDPDIQIIKNYFEDIDYYLQRDLTYNPLFLNTLFNFDLPFQKFEEYQPDFRNKILKLVSRVLYDFGLTLKSKPIRWEIFSEKKVENWVKTGGYNYITLERILGFLIVSGLRQIAMSLLIKLLEIYKKYPEIITLEQFQKWNRLLGISRTKYYG